MAIVPRATPDSITRVDALPGVRDTTRQSADPYAGLAGVENAFSGAAQQAQRYFQQEQERNDTAAVLAARKGLSDWERTFFDPENPEGIGKFRGTKALGADEAAVPDFDRHAAQLRANLNPRAQAMFDQVAFGVREGITGRLQTYMRGEHERALEATNKAALNTLLGDAVAAGTRGDEARSQQLLVEAAAAQRRVDEEAGQSPEVIAYNTKALATEYHAQRLDTLIDTDWKGAQAYLATNRDVMLPEVAAKMEAKLRPIAEQAAIEEDVGALFSGGAPVSGEQFYSGVESVVSRLGGILGSKAGGEHNKGSKHYTGHAVDIPLGASATPQAKANADKMIAALQGAGFRVLDEREKPAGQKVWSGPHLHVEVPGGGAPAPQTLGDALAWVRSRYDDPRKRNAAEAEVRSRWSVMEADRADNERMRLEAMRDKVANGRGTLRERLGGDYAEAVRQGWLGSLSAGLEGDIIRTDPAVYDRLKRLAVTNPAEFAKPQTMVEIMKSAGSLSTQALADLTGDWQAMHKPDAASKVADWSTDAERVDRGLQSLGIAKRPKEEQQTLRGQFRLAYDQAVRARVQATGKKLLPAEGDQILSSVVRNFGQMMAEGRTGMYDSYNKLALGVPVAGANGKPVALSPQDRATIEAELRRRGLPVTEAAVVRIAAESLE